jgi:two-component system LytT family response regulator
MSGPKIRVLIIDDEPLARMRIRQLIDEDPDLEILGECADGQSAVIDILESRPDLVFLDIKIPDIDGFAVLQLIDPPLMPRVIFVAAGDPLDRQVIEASLIDCLTKPISRVQFLGACRRIKDDMIKPEAGLADSRVQELLDKLRKRKLLAYSKWLAAHTAQGIELISIDEILWLEAPGSGVWLHAEQRFCVIQRCLDEVEKILDPTRFMRISLNALVSVQAIQKIRHDREKLPVIVLHDNTKLQISAPYVKNVLNTLRP